MTFSGIVGRKLSIRVKDGRPPPLVISACSTSLDLLRRRLLSIILMFSYAPVSALSRENNSWRPPGSSASQNIFLYSIWSNFLLQVLSLQLLSVSIVQNNGICFRTTVSSYFIHNGTFNSPVFMCYVIRTKGWHTMTALCIVECFCSHPSSISRYFKLKEIQPFLAPSFAVYVWFTCRTTVWCYICWSKMSLGQG